MAGPKFFETRMGKTYYESTLPGLVRQLTRLNDNIEAAIAAAVVLKCTDSPACAKRGCADCERSYGPQR